MLLQSIMTTNAIVLIIFIMCYFGHTVTTDSSLVADSIYNGSWYLFPINLQKSIIFLIQRSQHPFIFKAYKMYQCTLRSFTDVSVWQQYYLHEWEKYDKSSFSILFQIMYSAFQIFMLFRSVTMN